MMPSPVEQLLQDALELSPEERLEFMDKLQAAISDQAINERVRIAVVEERLAAYRRGEMETIDAEEFFAEIEQLGAAPEPGNPALDELWAAEAEARLDAFERGEIEAVPAEEVFARLRQRRAR